MILFEKIAIITSPYEPALADAYLLVGDDGKIAYVGDTRPDCKPDRVISGTRKALIPGLINAHTHLPMTVFRGFGEGCELHEWLNNYIFPAEDKLDARCVSACTDLAIAECVRFGTTSVTDMYMFEPTVAERIDRGGMKANLCRAITKFSCPSGFEWSGDKSTPDSREALELFDRFNGHDNSRIVVDAGIHGEYTSEPYLWEKVAAFAKERNIRLHVHLSETKSEHEECVGRWGMTPAEVLEKHGVFDVPANCAHCVWTTPHDHEILAAHGATAVHNPVSNMKLASGFAPVTAMKNAGVNVALGTDGVSSNNSHDMFEEIKAAAIIHKAANLDPSLVPAPDAFAMATVNGAKAQGRENECGKLAVGFDADITMLDLDAPHLYPMHSLLSNVVFAARGSDVCMTMVRGRTLYENGEYKTVDVERARYEIEHYAFPKIWG